VAKAISLLRTVDRLAPVLHSRMEGPRYVAGSCAGMLQIGSLLSATHAACRSSKKLTRGIAAPADDQRRQRHWRFMPTVSVPAPQPKPGCGSAHFGERRWHLGALAHDHEAGPLRALREAARSSCRNSRLCPRSWGMVTSSCEKCGRRNLVTYRVGPKEAWGVVVRNRWKSVCPSCFDSEAEIAGVRYQFIGTRATSWSNPAETVKRPGKKRQ
jgi:hypothetical protein